MVVNRRTFNIKPGRMQDALALVRAEIDNRPMGFRAVRAYAPNIAPFDVLAFEFEWDSVAQAEQEWDKWNASDAAAEFLPKWADVVAGGGTNEFWNLAE
jgi:hypothetical protein